MLSVVYLSTYKHSLSTHVKNVHQKSENTNCSECNKSIQKKNLKIHMKKFHSGEQTLYNCNICTYQSLHQGALSTHVTNVHQKSKYVTCVLVSEISIFTSKILQRGKK